jgi:hypothetical protein
MITARNVFFFIGSTARICYITGICAGLHETVEIRRGLPQKSGCYDD